MSLSSPIVIIALALAAAGLLMLLIGRRVHNDTASWSGTAVGVIGLIFTVFFGLQAHADSESSKNNDPRTPGDVATGGATTGPPTTIPTTAKIEQIDAMALPKGMAGKWTGIVLQGGDKYPASVNLSNGRAGDQIGISDYDTLACSGRLTLTSGGNDVRLKEDVSSTNCVDDELRLQLVGNELYVEFWYQGSKVAYATLTHP